MQAAGRCCSAASELVMLFTSEEGAKPGFKKDVFGIEVHVCKLSIQRLWKNIPIYTSFKSP